jgi:hypothetical protein
VSLTNFRESVVEEAALARLESLGCVVKHGLEIAPGELEDERIMGRAVLPGDVEPADSLDRPDGSDASDQRMRRRGQCPAKGS